ncbi:hypothetical protein ACN3XK_08890 [Actinomadura welshii]
MLDQADRLGDTYLYFIGPIVIFLALIVWIAMTLMTSRHPWSRRKPRGSTGVPDRGPVQGGIIRGSPSQRTRRDPAPSETHREAMRDIEVAREREAAQRARETGEDEAHARTRSGAKVGKRSRRRR